MGTKRSGLSISTYFSICFGLTFVIASILVVAVVYKEMHNEALVGARERTSLLLERNLATHHYFSQDLKPKLFEKLRGIESEDYFEPTWMSSTYAIRQIDGYFTSSDEYGDYYFKECAVNARSVENEADDYEKAFIEELNKKPELLTRSEVREFEGEAYYVTLRRGERMEESCLRCHSTPDNAPGDLLAQYGSDRSFNRSAGDTVSAMSIRVPLTKAYAATRATTIKLSVLLMVVLGVMFSAQYFFTKRVILQPLRILKNKSSEISFNPEHLGEEMPLPRSRELGEVVSAFNNMSVKLRDHRNELEDEVNKRTAEIKGLNEQYEQLVEGTENFVTRVDTEGKFLYVNQTSEKIYGLRPEECIGLSAFDFIHPDDREMTRNAFVSWLANKTENITFENRQVSCSGQVRDMLWTCTLRFDESGEVVWIDSIAKDITERKEVESALQVKTYDLGERVKELNCLYGLSHLAEQDGISLEEVFQGLTELIQAGWQYPEITAARITFEGRHFETANFRKTAWIQSADIKVRGQKIGGIKVCYLKKMPEIDEGPFLKEERDLLNALAERSGKIISRKQAENELKDTHDELEARVTQRTYQLRQLNKQLIHAEQGERRRLARVLHDHLQQMLVGAKLNIGILTLKLKDPSLCRSLNEVNSLLDDCIDESRSLTVELCPPVLHEGSFIAAIQWLGRRFENQYRLTVAIDAEGNFDHIEQDCRVFIFEAVRELLFNIVKHAGTNTAAIRMSCTADNLIRVVIEDEGAGFDVEQYEDRKKLDGGFGLFSIRERIAAIGGTLDISSWPGEGTHATLLVPLSSFCPLELGASETASQPSSASKQSSGPDEGSGSEGGDDKIRVLLAEDHAIVRESLNSLLGQEADIEVVGEACNGKVAVEMTSLKQPEFVIMDINMPVMDGVEATRRIKSEYPHIKVIALSAHDQEDMADAIIHAGAESYLSKKNASEQLVSAIRLRRS